MKYFGKYRGLVINPNDPEERSRLLIKVPSMGDMELGWAEGVFPSSFAALPTNYTVLPEREDFVWVEFEQGDIQRPLWTGIMWKKK